MFLMRHRHLSYFCNRFDLYQEIRVGQTDDPNRGPVWKRWIWKDALFRDRKRVKVFVHVYVKTGDIDDVIKPTPRCRQYIMQVGKGLLELQCGIFDCAT